MNEGLPDPSFPPRRGLTGREQIQIGAAVAILILRLVLYWNDPRWKGVADWVPWICAYWVFTVLAGRSRAWPAVTVVLILGLSAIYFEGNLPLTFETLRWNLWP